MDNAIKIIAIIGAFGIGFLLIVFFMTGGIYNGIIVKEEAVKAQFGNVESSYQRRFDLLPNLFETVAGYAKHEKEIFDEFAKARQAYAGSGDISQKVDSMNQMESTLSKLMVVVEQYPELKADANFRDLQAQLEGTENRLDVERKRYNEAVAGYNVAKRSFPANMLISMMGWQFKEYEGFTAEPGAKVVPKANFTG